MKLAASLIVKDELGRYLEPCIRHLLEFCDAVYVLDDGSVDGTFEWLATVDGVDVLQLPQSRFFEHEGRARQQLLTWTLARPDPPTHVLAVDADEVVSDGQHLRKLCETDPAHVFMLEMVEVWEADTDGLCVRMDGGWRPHPVTVVWRVPASVDASWRIRDRALACGRVPAPVAQVPHRLVRPSGVDILHLGWANEAEREHRYQRYAVADGGRFHARRHLDSIRWGCDRVHLEPRAWPPGLDAYKGALLERANTTTEGAAV